MTVLYANPHRAPGSRGAVVTASDWGPVFNTKRTAPLGAIWLIVSRLKPGQPVELRPSLGSVVMESVAFPVVPGYRSPASPRSEQPTSGAPG